MNREGSMIKILTANSRLQKHMSIILEAKTKEIEKARNWLYNHVHENGYPDEIHQLRDPLKLHQYIVGVIDGITKVENGLAKNMGILLNSGAEAVGEELNGLLEDDGGWQ